MKLEEAKEILNSIDVIDLRETHDVTDEIYNLAIETVLQELKHLQKNNEEIRNEYHKRVLERIDLEQELKDSISKDKIRELIENETLDIAGFECIPAEDLENLLRED